MDFRLLEIIVLIFINSFALFLIIIVLANSSKERMYRWFAFMSFLLLGWVDFAYVGYSIQDLVLSVLAYRVNVAFVAIFFFAVYMFYVDCFLKISLTRFRLILFILSLLFAGLALFTDTIILEVVARDWGNEVHFGSLNDFFNIFAVLTSSLFVYYFISRYVGLSKSEKRKVNFFLVGIFFLIGLNVIFNVLSPIVLGTARYQHLGDYSAIVFFGFTAYAMLKEKFLDIRVALTAFLITIIGTLLLIDILILNNNSIELVIKLVMFIFFFLISILLVRSVLNEIRQREELARVNKALGISNQRYLDLAREQEDIIDVMGHEIRTPLTAVVQEIKLQKQTTMAQAEKFTSGKATIPEYQEAMNMIFDTFKTIDKASANQVALVTSMLETARIDKGRFELNYANFDIIESVRSSVSIMQKTADADIYDITFALKNVGPNLKTFMVDADEVRITQAVQALISNAMKYGINPVTGKSRIQVTLSVSKENIRIEIKDNGTGIAKEDIAKLGQKFMRLNADMTGKLKRPGGTGLGLYVVKGIMDHHGGKMEIQSAGLGKGASFSIEFPAKRKSK